MNYIFGPVNSRRLGRSLGIDLFPKKICNLDCVYCEVGPTAATVNRRAAYSPATAVMAEVADWCRQPELLDTVDVLTVTAKGEPTLHSDIGIILRYIKDTARKPVVVLTNGTTLNDETVRCDLMAADIVVPSLDAARPESFARVDRPAAGVDVWKVIEGLTLFSHAFSGLIWLEILLVRGMNDSPEDLDALTAALRMMRLDRIQLNTVVRPPADPAAHPLQAEELSACASRLGAELNLPVDVSFADQDVTNRRLSDDKVSVSPVSLSVALEEIQEIVQRRPCTAADIDRLFRLGGPGKVEQLLMPLVQAGILHIKVHEGTRYYTGPADRDCQEHV
ncbi:MAG: radical SAM protein [Desulfobulbus sp.]|nr:radical SAM protein [Desulfobulbus sp.]